MAKPSQKSKVKSQNFGHFLLLIHSLRPVRAFYFCLLGQIALFSTSYCQQHYLLSSIYVSGGIHIPESDILKLFSSKPGDTLREAILEEDFRRTLQLYENTGYPL